jgi:myosin heavy subunit
MSTEKISKRRPPRGPRADVEAVTRNAQKAGEQLDREQADSVINLAQALDEIGDGEAAARLESRVDFLERQVERLVNRRDEADRGYQGEFAVMRARIEDALEAFGSTVEEQKEAAIGLEKRIGALIAAEVKRSSEAAESLRGEVASKLQEAVTRFEKGDARVRGELNAVQEDFEARSRAVAESMAAHRSVVEDTVEAATGELSSRVEEATAELERRLRESAETHESMRETVETELAKVGETAGALQELIEIKMGSAISGAREEIEARLQEERREIDGRLGEANAGFRVEGQKMKDNVETRVRAVVEAVELARKDFAARILGSEEKAAGAAVHLESMVTQLRRQLAAFEDEWSGGLGEESQEISDLKVRVEELVGRVSSAEARRATERGSAQVAAQALAARVEAVEDRLRETMDTGIGKLATRMEVLSSQMGALNDSGVSAEEKFGMIDYLSRRVAEMSERFDELSGKLSALAKSPARAAAPGAPAPSGPGAEELLDKVSALERTIGFLVSRPSAPAAPGSDGADALRRMESMEKTITAIQATITSRQAQIASRVDELERKSAPSQTILPDRKRGRWH